MSIRRRGMARLARRNAERRLAVLGCIRLFGFAVKRVLAQKWVVFLFLEPVWGARTFLVPRGHVTRNRFASAFPSVASGGAISLAMVGLPSIPAPGVVQ